MKPAVQGVDSAEPKDNADLAGDATVIDVPLVRSLLSEQHPDLADLSLHRVAAGWDNAIFRLGDDLGAMVASPHADAAMQRMATATVEALLASEARS